MEVSTRFMWALQSLAASHDIQERLYPDFVEVPDEMVMEHAQAHELFMASEDASSLMPVQTIKILELDRYIQELSDRDDRSLWTMEALRVSGEWSVIRKMAAEAIDAMGWSQAIPPSSEERGDMYFQ